MNYIAYTIGPIYDTIFNTLNGDNKTKKLKAGSYFFSYFMKNLLVNIQNDFEILVPYVGGDTLTKEHTMGIFHDRFIAQSEMTEDQIHILFDARLKMTLENLAKEIGQECSGNRLLNNMDNHLVVANEKDLRAIDDNIIFALNTVLDSMELQRSFPLEEKEKNCIALYQESMVKTLARVKTLENIAGISHYYAVITADGDQMGQKIKHEATEKPENIKEISEKLYHFFTEGDDIQKLTNEGFGGELIYAGGDDILAFMPVKCVHGTVMDYMGVLNQRFRRIVGEDVSLSFGVSIVYCKYPLRDAIKMSFDLLHAAKSTAKNSVALKVTKHSGQWMETTLQMDSKRYEAYSELLNEMIHEQHMALPHAFHHSLNRYKDVVTAIYREESTASLEALFKVVYNDEKNEEVSRGIDAVRKYIDMVAPQDKTAYERLFSELSIIKFLREDRK